MSQNKKIIKGIIVDWTGTTVDYGCLGPVYGFYNTFADYKINLSINEIRKPMGLDKKEHVASLLSLPRVQKTWYDTHGEYPSKQTVESVYNALIINMSKILSKYANPIPGCVESINYIRKKGIKIGSCTGYSKRMMNGLIEVSNEYGFHPDCIITSDEVPMGRPSPWMCWENCKRLDLYPPSSVIKIGDTISDILEGLNSGFWSVGVTRTSSYLGLTELEASELKNSELKNKEDEIKNKFLSAGAHYVLNTIADLPGLIEMINKRLSLGDKP